MKPERAKHSLQSNQEQKGSEHALALARARLLALADAYLGYAMREPKRWRLLFEHRLSDTAEVPDWYQTKLAGLFGHVDAPLQVLSPSISAENRALFGRALFSAVHGVVVLGLEERLGAMPAPLVSAQAAAIVKTCLAGLAAEPKLGQITPSS